MSFTALTEKFGLNLLSNQKTLSPSRATYIWILIIQLIIRSKVVSAA